MIRTKLATGNQFSVFIRTISNSSNASKRFMQTAPLATNEVTYVPYKAESKSTTQSKTTQPESSAWAKHSMPSTRSFKDLLNKNKSNTTTTTKQALPESETAAATIPTTSSPTSTQQETTASTPIAQPKKRVRRTLKPRKALITLTPSAISHLKALMDQPVPQLIRIGVQNRGCSGLTYNLEYIETPNKFDEVVEQDGVKVIIDSKALFSIVGSEMDWLDDKLSSRFIFKNPNSKGTCGCGESFMV